MAQTTNVRWTAATRRKLHGFRAPHKNDPKDLAPTPGDAWARLGASVARLEVHGDDEQAEIARAVRAELVEGALPKELDPAREVYRAGLVVQGITSDAIVAKYDGWSFARDLMAVWASVGGVGFAVSVLHQAPAFSIIKFPGGVRLEPFSPSEGERDPATGQPREPIGPFDLTCRISPLWWALRARLSGLDSEAVEASARECAAFLEGVPAGRSCDGAWFRRCALLFALSGAPSVTRAGIDTLARAWDGQKRWSGLAMLYAAAPDASAALELAKRSSQNPLDCSLDIVEAFDLDARPVLEHLFEECRKYSSLQHLRDLRAALKLVGAG